MELSLSTNSCDRRRANIHQVYSIYSIYEAYSIYINNALAIICSVMPSPTWHIYSNCSEACDFDQPPPTKYGVVQEV